MTEAEKWMLGCTILSTLAAVAGVIVAVVVANKKQEVKIDQPLLMKMQEEFVPQKRFDEAMQENKHEHENLFKKIGGVERGAVQRLDTHLSAMQVSAEVGREKLHKRLNRQSEILMRICGRLDVKVAAEEES